jgi:hypothetical protein
MIKFCPSVVAASAVIITLHTLQRECLHDGLKLAGHIGLDLRDCVTTMMRLYADSIRSNLTAVKTKYSLSKYNHVSLIPVPQTMPDVLSA